jgi:hypothetical protein
MKSTRSSSLRSVLVAQTAVAALLQGFAFPVWANEPSPTELAVARRLFKEATELELEREWEAAAAKLREAIQVKDTPGLRFHLAHCEEQMGLLVEAMLDYDRANDLLAAGAKAPDVAALLEPARQSLERRLPTLVIVTPAGVPGVSVELNGRPLARSIFGRPAPINPGRHSVRVTAPGHSTFTTHVDIGEGARERVQARLTPLPPSPSPTTAATTAPNSIARQSASPSSQGSALTYVLVGESAFTIASLGVGLGYLFVKSKADERVQTAQARSDQLQDLAGVQLSCDGSGNDAAFEKNCASLNDAIEDYNRARLLSLSGFIGAGVGAASIALTLALWPQDEPAPRVSASPTEDGWFASVHGSF